MHCYEHLLFFLYTFTRIFFSFLPQLPILHNLTHPFMSLISGIESLSCITKVLSGTETSADTIVLSIVNWQVRYEMWFPFEVLRTFHRT